MGESISRENQGRDEILTKNLLPGVFYAKLKYPRLKIIRKFIHLSHIIKK